MESLEFCPKCGGKLTKIEVKRGLPRYQCPQKHLWEITQDRYSKDWHFREIKWATCPDCLEDYPAPDLDRVSNKCEKCYQKAKDEWRMDSEKSYATLTITPIITDKGKWYNLDTSIEIQPYPNPFTFGGLYGSDCAKDEAELEKAIERFNNEVERWKKNGLTNIKIIRETEERVLTSQVKMEVAVKSQKQEAGVKQLSLEFGEIAEFEHRCGEREQWHPPFPEGEEE